MYVIQDEFNSSYRDLIDAGGDEKNSPKGN